MLPLGERDGIAVRFAEGGRVTAQSADGAALGGRWWWSRGHLHVALDGIETVAWQWRELALHLGAVTAAPGGVSGR